MIRVLLVDDHQLVRAGLSTLLDATEDITVIGEAADGRAAVTAVGSTDVDVVLMDLSMPVLDGVAATREVLRAKPDTRVVVLSSFSEQSRVREAISAGAIGYVLKDCGPDELVAAVRSAAAGHAPLDPRVAGALLPASRSGRTVDQPRDRSVTACGEGHGEQADRAGARDHRAHGEGAPRQRVPAHRCCRPHFGCPMGAREPRLSDRKPRLGTHEAHLRDFGLRAGPSRCRGR